MKKQISDCVITWVDGSDPLWFRQKQNAKKSKEFLLISTTVLNAIATGKF